MLQAWLTADYLKVPLLATYLFGSIKHSVPLLKFPVLYNFMATFLFCRSLEHPFSHLSFTSSENRKVKRFFWLLGMISCSFQFTFVFNPSANFCGEFWHSYAARNVSQQIYHCFMVCKVLCYMSSQSAHRWEVMAVNQNNDILIPSTKGMK